MCGDEIKSVIPQTTGHLKWHISHTGNGKGVWLCSYCEVAGIKNAFCERDMQLYLVLVLVRTTCFDGACISVVSL